MDITTGPGLWKAASILAAIVASTTGAATFLVGIATTADVDKARNESAPKTIVENVKKNTDAIADLDKRIAVGDAVTQGKLDVLLAAQAELAKRSPRRRQQMAQTIQRLRAKAKSAGSERDPVAGIEAVEEVAGDAGPPN